MEPRWLEVRLAPVLEELGLPRSALGSEAVAALCVYARELLAWNERTNLTGARTSEALADEHLADALALLPHLPDRSFHFVDVGSGGGLPGVPLAILRPDATGVLLEPTGKKHAFLAHVVRALARAGLAARAERLEEHLAAGGARAYDLAVSRAVWPAADWLARAEPLLRPGGVALALEGASSADVPAPSPFQIERHPYLLGSRRRTLLVAQLRSTSPQDAP